MENHTVPAKRTYWHNIIKVFGVLLCTALLFFNYYGPMDSIRRLSSEVHLQTGETITLPLKSGKLFSVHADDDTLAVSFGHDQTLAQVTGRATEKDSNISIKLLGLIPVKQISVQVRDEIILYPGGTSIGVTLHTRGALVVGVSGIELANGEEICPAAVAGVQAGDLIEKINGIEIKDAAHLAKLCNESKDSIKLTILRGNEELLITMRPVLDPVDKQMRMGMWVRDSTAGVGTLSFFDPHSQWYAALGHAITDIDTRARLTVRDGEIVQSVIVDIVQGAQGEPGELRGSFGATSLPLGTIEINSQYGIFGRMYRAYSNPLYPDGLIMAYPEETQLGPAQLITTLNSDGMQAFDCSIVKLNPQSSPSQKGMVMEITDEELLKSTGGIVQGMSGSPIVQNGKLIGVVTHVFINDPTKGYCMYAQWMKEQIA